jgi:Xaa-Pro dipeptidase
MNVLSFLNKSEKKAKDLFETIIQKQVIIAGKSEKQLNNDIYQITSELFGIKKF